MNSQQQKFLTNQSRKIIHNVMSSESCGKCAQMERKLKIKISDYEFEIKKIKEDKSTEKAMYEIHLLKQVKRWQELYNKQKGQREDQAKNWMNKHDLTVDKYEADIAALKEKNIVELDQTTEKLKSESADKVQKLTMYYEKRISELTEKYEQTITKIKSQSESKINQLISEHETTVTNLKKSHKLTLEQKTRIFQSRLLGSQSQRIKQQKLHEDTKNQAKDTQAKLYQQIFMLRKNVSELETQLSDQIKDSNSKQENIEQLKEAIEKMKVDNESQKQAQIKDHKRQLEQCKEEYKTKLTTIYRQSLDHCSKYESAIGKIQEKRESQKALYLNNLEEINSFVQNRASRTQDIEEIEFLRENLFKKTKQYDTLADQLKFFRLELENKEETYNKIFVPIANPSNETLLHKRKQFKLRRQGKSVTTVREALLSLNSVGNVGGDRKFPPKPKIL